MVTNLDTLEVVNGPEDGTVHTIGDSNSSIGKRKDCDIHIKLDDLVSEINAQIIKADGVTKVRAVGARTVRLNGKRTGMLRGRVMKDGDILEVGATKLQFHQGIAATPEDVALGEQRGIIRRLGSVLKNIVTAPLRAVGRAATWSLAMLAKYGLIKTIRSGLLTVILIMLLAAMVPQLRPIWTLLFALIVTIYPDAEEVIDTIMDVLKG